MSRAVLAVLTCVVVAHWSCGDDDKPTQSVSDTCRLYADERWEALHYLNWATSDESIRTSPVLTALPCSTNAVTVGNVVDCPDPEQDDYYDVIGEPQFIAGWADVRDSRGNRVLPTEIDSVENFHSDYRLDYLAGECELP